MIYKVIERVKGCQRQIGICSQAASDYPEFAQFLVRQGIDSISLTLDSMIKTTLCVAVMAPSLTEASGGLSHA